MLSFTVFRPLLIAEVALRRLNAHMTQEELNLFKFPSSLMAQTGTPAAKVVGSNIPQTAFRASGMNHAPDDFWAESVFSNPLLMARNIGPVVTPAALNQVSTATLTQSRHRNRPHVAALAHDIGDYPMLVSLLEAFERQSSYLCSSEAVPSRMATIA
jgi:hypothetical protein